MSWKQASNLPFIAESLLGNSILKIGKFASFLHSQINQYTETDELKSFSLVALTRQWSCFASILNCIILEPTRTCNGSFDDAPLFSLLNHTNLIMKNYTRMNIHKRFFPRIILIQLDNLARTKFLTHYLLKDKKQGYKKFG